MNKINGLVLFLLMYSSLKACTTFVLENENSLLFARNLDWHSENGVVVVNPRYQAKRSLVMQPNESIYWISKYGSVTFNQFGKEFPFGGMNERGLVVEIMLAPATYPEVDERKAVNELQWIQYQLDNASTVEEVIAYAEQIRIAPVGQELHYLVADASGAVAALEFIDGKLVVYHKEALPYPVLENEPYAASLQHYKKGASCRFKTVCDRIKTNTAKSNEEQVNFAFTVLKEVEVDLAWSIVYDIKNKQIHFHTKSSPNRRNIHFSALDFSCSSGAKLFDLERNPMGSINNKFTAFDTQLNQRKMSDAILRNELQFTEMEQQFYLEYHQGINCR